MAQAWRARLVLMQAVLAPPSASLDGADWERIQVEAVVEARAYLEDMAESMSGQVAAVEIASPYGRPTQTILETIDALQADGVIMTTHGRTGLSHLLHGSVTEAILASSNVPVFVVSTRSGDAPAPGFSPLSARLLVPQDGSPFDGAARDAALDMLGPRGEIVLVAVVAPPEHVEMDATGRHVLAYLDEQEEALTREARVYLAAVAETLRKRPGPVVVKTDVQLGDPAFGIATAVFKTRADLIVMATHGRTGLRRALAGSVAGDVVRTVSIPVVLVHPTPTPKPNGTRIRQPVFEAIGPVPTF
jgi:nucleotide-binding universal stress UspA family protein